MLILYNEVLRLDLRIDAKTITFADVLAQMMSVYGRKLKFNLQERELMHSNVVKCPEILQGTFGKYIICLIKWRRGV